MLSPQNFVAIRSSNVMQGFFRWVQGGQFATPYFYCCEIFIGLALFNISYMYYTCTCDKALMLTNHTNIHV